MHLVCGFDQTTHSLILFYFSRNGCDETAHMQILQLNRGFDASRVYFKPSTLYHTVLHVYEWR